MAAAITKPNTSAPSSSSGAQRKPVLFWSGLGAATVVLIVVVMTQWVLGGITTVDPGDDPYDGWKLAILRAVEWGQFAAFVVIMWAVLINPVRKRIPLGFDAYFAISALLLNFWDPLDNFWNFAFQYNAHHLNVGSWGDYIPFWHSSSAETWAVPLGFVFGAYVWAFVAAVRIGSAILNKNRAAGRPLWMGLAAVFVANAALTGVSENAYLHIGAIANIQTPSALTLWHGGPDGLPLYNPVFFGLTWTVLSVLRWTRDEDGISVVERGVLALDVSDKVRATMRFLAIFAALQVTYITLYFLPFNLFALFADPIRDLPSYFPTP
jgi:hypothetical protein